jgi:hypothetical protein
MRRLRRSVLTFPLGQAKTTAIGNAALNEKVRADISAA